MGRNRSSPRANERRRAQSTADAGEADDADDESNPNHLTDVPDGAGCTEIWETLAERREGTET